MNLIELSKADLSASSVMALLGLPPPETATLGGSPKQIVAAIDNLFSLWRQILVDKATLPLDRYEWTGSSGQKHHREGAELRGRLLLVITGYFDFLAVTYAAKRSAAKDSPFPNAFRIRASLQLLPAKETLGNDLRSDNFQIFLVGYLQAFVSLYLVGGMLHTASLPRMMLGHLEAITHDALGDAVSSSFDVIGEGERIAARRLVKSTLDLAKKSYKDISIGNAEHPMGVFSAIRLGELALLAKRDAALQSRYGAKNVERVFEKQLALVMQSFGLYVVSTRTGQSTVDLVCISGNLEERTTFLVEAKTTKSPYSLPAKDARALRDYVRDVRRSLTTLPPLSYVLLVAYEPSKTLEAKLVRLEAEASVPVRFVRAQQLASLRERIPGPLPLKVFSTSVLTDSHVLGENFVDNIVKSYEEEQRAHQTFVEAMLSARGVVPRASEWNSRETEK